MDVDMGHCRNPAGIPGVLSHSQYVKVLDAGCGYLAENSPKARPWLDGLIAANPESVRYRRQRAELLEALDRTDEVQAEWGRHLDERRDLR